MTALPAKARTATFEAGGTITIVELRQKTWFVRILFTTGFELWGIRPYHSVEEARQALAAWARVAGLELEITA